MDNFQKLKFYCKIPIMHNRIMEMYKTRIVFNIFFGRREGGKQSR